jgi:hypothetical protein
VRRAAGRDHVHWLDATYRVLHDDKAMYQCRTGSLAFAMITSHLDFAMGMNDSHKQQIQAAEYTNKRIFLDMVLAHER